VFPVERMELAQAYADRLASDGVIRGLIGPRETPRLWTRHILNSAILAEMVAPGASVADVGSGAGLPGIPLAIARPDVTVTLIEPLLRRATFLQELVTDLALTSVTVIRARAEDLHRSVDLAPGFTLVTSRAVSALPQLVDWSMPLVAPTGSMVALKGLTASDEVVAASEVLRAWGCADPVVHQLGVGVLSETTNAIQVAWDDPSSVSWPARRGSRPARTSRGGSVRRRPGSDRRAPHRPKG
jgi:16S rRNA (guanine527-N7)-methyltransferase